MVPTGKSYRVNTVNRPGDVADPRSDFTLMTPLCAPCGTVTVMRVFESTVKSVALTPPNLTTNEVCLT